MKSFKTLTAKQQFVLREVVVDGELIDFKWNFNLLDHYRVTFKEPNRRYHHIYRTILRISNSLTKDKVLKKQTVWLNALQSRSNKVLTTSKFTLNKKWAAENRKNLNYLRDGKNFIIN